MTFESNKYTAVLLLILLAVIWGTAFILIKQGLKVFGPAELGSLRIVLASLFIFPLAISRRRGLQKGDYLKLFFSGMLGVFIPAFLLAIAQTRVDSSVTGILSSLTPIWTMILGILLYRQKYRMGSIAGVVISLVGCVILSVTRSGGGFIHFNYYAFLVVLTCASHGANLNFIKFKISNDLHPTSIASVSLLLIGPLAGLFLFGYTDFLSTMQSDPGAWRAFGMVVILALVSTVLAHLLFYKLLSMSSPMFVSTVTYLMPIVAIVWGLLDGEKLQWEQIFGMMGILAGVYLISQK